jgi:hypothetical protein
MFPAQCVAPGPALCDRMLDCRQLIETLICIHQTAGEQHCLRSSSTLSTCFLPSIFDLVHQNWCGHGDAAEEILLDCSTDAEQQDEVRNRCTPITEKI